MDKEKFSEQETLNLINQMINTAKNNLQKGSGNFFILWGYLVAGTALLNFILIYILFYLKINPNKSFYIWFSMLIGVFIDYKLGKKQKEKAETKSYVDQFTSGVWRAFFISAGILVGNLLILNIHNPTLKHWYIFNPIILILTGIGTYFQGIALKFNPLKIGAYCFWGLSIPCFYVQTLYQTLLLALAMILCFIIPGHLLNKKAEYNV